MHIGRASRTRTQKESRGTYILTEDAICEFSLSLMQLALWPLIFPHSILPALCNSVRLSISVMPGQHPLEGRMLTT